MHISVLCMLFLVITPTIGNAQISFDSLKEGAARAASAVGETTGSAVDAAGKVAGKATGALKENVDGTTESLGDEATPEATRAKLDAMARRTLARLFAEQPDSRDLFDRSAGYAVFDKREASFYLVAGYGRLALSFAGLAARDEMVLTACRQRAVPVAIAMAGGYARDIDDTVRIHCQTVLAARQMFNPLLG